MGIEHFQRLNVRGEHGNDAAFFLALQLCRAKPAQSSENLITENRQKLKGNIVVAVLFKVAQDAPQDTAADGKTDYSTVRQCDVFAQCFGNTQRAEHGHTHGGEEPQRTVDNSQNHHIGKTAEQQNQTCHNLCTAAAEIVLFFHSAASCT